MKKTILLISVVSLFIIGCKGGGTSATYDEIDQQRQETLQKEGQAEAGMPAIHNFQEKKMVKMLYELRDNPNLINYAYTFSEVTGKYQYFGKCVGYGIPYSTQFSSPSKVASGVGDFGQYAHDAIMPQSEPNGLFMPTSSEGTWLMMLNPDKNNEPTPVYVEPKVIVSPFKLPNQ